MKFRLFKKKNKKHKSKSTHKSESDLDSDSDSNSESENNNGVNEETNKHEDEQENEQENEQIDNKLCDAHLVCDDAYSNRLVMRRLLNRKEQEVHESSNGLEAIEKVKEFGEYKIIWIDLQMPKMNGVECTTVLRNEYNYKGPIIGITGLVDKDSIDRCKKAGMTQIIPKPVKLNVLYMYIDKYSHS